MDISDLGSVPAQILGWLAVMRSGLWLWLRLAQTRTAVQEESLRRCEVKRDQAHWAAGHSRCPNRA